MRFTFVYIQMDKILANADALKACANSGGENLITPMRIERRNINGKARSLGMRGRTVTTFGKFPRLGAKTGREGQ